MSGVTTSKLYVPTLKKKGWKETLVGRINTGKVVPIVGNMLCNDMIFGSHQGLLDGWAETLEYPLPGRRLLPRMTQYEHIRLKADGADNRAIKELFLQYIDAALEQVADAQLVAKLREDVNYSRLKFSQKAERVQRPAFTEDSENALLLLAGLPLPIYLTTSYHDAIEMALRKVGKTPQSELCYWERDLRTIPSVFDDDAYTPDDKHPLVFHLHGRDSYPNSLVLTEDDHFDFLVAIAESRAVAVTNSTGAEQRDAAKDAIPVRVRQALADSALLLLGYGLHDWDFRTLLRGVIKPSTTNNSPKSIALQLDVEERQHNYVNDYLRYEAEFQVEWKSATAFMQEIYQLWQNQ